MSAAGAGGELHIALTLFKHAYHGVVALDSSDRLGDYAATLVANEKRCNATALELGDYLRCAVAAPLLGAGGCKVHILLGGVARLKQFLHGLEECHDGALGVRRSPAPDLAVGYITGERLVLPHSVGGNNILMAH